MSNSSAPLWPYSTASNDEPNPSGDPWGLGGALETQARLWNHFLDANRSFWSMYAPWLQMTPWLMNTAIAPTPEVQTSEEPQPQVNGIPDALESQARSWNRFFDANRNFWASMSWPVPGAPEVGEAPSRRQAVDAPRHRASADREEPAKEPSRKAARPSSHAAKKTQRSSRSR